MARRRRDEEEEPEEIDEIDDDEEELSEEELEELYASDYYDELDEYFVDVTELEEGDFYEGGD